LKKTYWKGTGFVQYHQILGKMNKLNWLREHRSLMPAMVTNLDNYGHKKA
jgi:hypothetical protein